MWEVFLMLVGFWEALPLIVVIAIIGFGVFWYLNRKSAWSKKAENAIKGATFQKVGYDRIEKVMPDQPTKLPQAWLTPNGAVVHSDTKPPELAMEIIDRAITNVVGRAFKSNPMFINPDMPLGWKKFRTHKEYRFWLMETPDKSVTPETLNFPILRTYHSATGYAAGITAGFEDINRVIEDVFPFTIMPKLELHPLTAEWLEHWGNTAENEVEHWVTANNTATFYDFKGSNDIHPIFKKS